MLRFITAGSVDDGKSTLIGRLLYDSHSILQDQYAEIERASARRGRNDVDLALLTDGLQAEREQGITIDVAYRYFSTPRRKFIIADTPGHEQYTRNMVTGASTAELAVVLLDVRKGMLVQTKRHAYLASLLGIHHLVFAINKMDLVDYQESAFTELRHDLAQFMAQLKFKQVFYLPISALHGDNVVRKSKAMPWYHGPSLLEFLETVHVDGDNSAAEFRFPVQDVARPTGKNVAASLHDFRGYRGSIESGHVAVDDEVTVLPAGLNSRISGIWTYDGELTHALAPQAVTLQLTDHIDVSRGDMIVKTSEAQPQVAREFQAMICWLSENAYSSSQSFLLKHTTRLLSAKLMDLDYRIDVNTLQRVVNPSTIKPNEIAAVRIKTSASLVIDDYYRHRSLGSFILIDAATHHTVAGGMILLHPQGT